ncbi:MAG TPA: hypothetical protein VJN70_16275 [Gemmatimonadaceae bacterium]|nr:hypothetical protein [Gemmatimonadaceae bacterium]
MRLHRIRFALAALVVTVSTTLTRSACATEGGSAPRDSSPLVAGVAGDRMVAPASLLAALAAVHRTIPSFSRQTKLACSACHYQFPQLTPFGRLFKLNGYTLTGLETIGQPADTTSETLKLAPIPPASAMLVTSLTHLSEALPATQNNTAVFPQQFSLFLAGQVTPKVGAFTQFTYAASDGSFGIDNVDVRYATHTSFAAGDLLFGLTVHNNPTVQDVWNTTPAWGFPFMSSDVAPAPSASTIIEGTLSQQVVGVGAYSLWNNLLYTELTAYRSAPQGKAQPLDSTATNSTKGVAPYWRVALEHQYPSTYLMLGTFGLASQLYPTGITGPINRYTDIGADAQIERKVDQGALIGRVSYIHENQTLNAARAAQPPTADFLTNTLETFRASASYVPTLRYGVSLQYFLTSGSTDPALYPPADVTGSRTGSPNSSGFLGEVTYNPWQNTRLGVQYTLYGKFNGAATNYDAAGRNASNNNSLYFYLWVAF